MGSVGLAACQSAEWAVGGLSTVLAQEAAPFGITVIEPTNLRLTEAPLTIYRVRRMTMKMMKVRAAQRHFRAPVACLP